MISSVNEADTDEAEPKNWLVNGHERKNSGKY